MNRTSGIYLSILEKPGVFEHDSNGALAFCVFFAVATLLRSIFSDQLVRLSG